jgi:hypothetical protein
MKGAIWQVLPAFEEILQGFEYAHIQHQPLDSQELSQQQPYSPQSSTHKRRRTRQSTPERAATTSTTSEGSTGDTDATTVMSAESDNTEVAESIEYLALQRHFSANIRRGWKKLDKYYNKTDVTPIHRVAVLLHLRLKWRWFERYWRHKPSWIVDAKKAIFALWSEYKDRTMTTPVATRNVI